MSLNSAATQVTEWRRNPAKFVYDNFKVEPDTWQLEALNVFPSQDKDKMRMSLQACAGPGKSAVLAWLGWNFLFCYGEKGNHPKGAAIATTWDNLKDNLWPEFAKWMSRSDAIKAYFEWTKERIFNKQHPETWFLSARSWSKTANLEEQGRTLSGIHSDFILILVDESGDIPINVLKSGEQALSSARFGKIIQAGNPTSLEGMLYAAATSLRHLWYVIRITGDPDDPARSKRIDIDWAREQIKQYGKDDPWVMSFILGAFPPASINALLGIEEVELAMKRAVKEADFSYAQKRIGIDVAREGNDRTVLFPRQGLVAFKPVIMRTQKGGDIAARLALAKTNWGSEVELFDDTGGWAGAAIEQYQIAGHTPLRIQFSGKANNPRYYNKRAEMWFLMAEWVKNGGALPNVPEMIKELTSVTYTFRNGKLILEEKEQIKKRIGVSPDIADALALTFALPEMPSSVGLIGSERGKFVSDYADENGHLITRSNH